MSNDLTRGTVFTRIRELLNKLRMEYNAQFHAVFYTSIGKIVCDIEPLAKEDALIGFADDPAAFTVDVSAIFKGESGFSEYLINAKNVIIYNSLDEEFMRSEQMILFADQILGFSLVRKQV